MSDHPIDDAALANFVGYFAERLNLAFAYFYCVFEFESDEDFTADDFTNARAWGLQTIREACLTTTLIAVRDLDDVLSARTKTTKPDDFRVSDLGFPHVLRFLAESERIVINKRIAHSTLPGAVPKPVRWDVFELVSKAVSQSLLFLDWAADHDPGEHFETWSSAIYCRARTKNIYRWFVKEIRQRRSATDSKSHV
jgi:hypothetical protein